MCGLVMVVNKTGNGFNTIQQNVFASLLYLSGGYRGRDGVGVTVIDTHGNVQLAKDACTVDNFLFTDEYVHLNSLAYKNGVAMIGHNRAATRGTISDKNSHPFVIDDKIVLVHNGTFYGDHKKIKNTEVDSEVIGHLLAENENPAEALKKVNAAYALMWYNVDKKQIHIIRNSSRTLYFMETDNSYIYASEEIFLKFVIEKHSLTPISGPFLIEEHNLGTFTIEDDGQVKCANEDLECKYEGQTGYETDWEDYLKAQRIRYGSEPSFDYYGNIHSKVVESLKDINTISHGDWCKLLPIYKDGETVKINVVDMIEDASAGGKDVLVMGHTMDDHKMNAYFKVYSKSLQEVCEELTSTEAYITISKTMWKRVDEKFPVDISTPMDTWIGVPLVIGYNPKPLVKTENNVH